MRRRYVWDPERKELVEVTPASEAASESAYVWGDIESYKSTIDGTVITDRKQHREHMRRHNVAPTADFKETWRKAREERTQHLNGTHPADRKARIRALCDAFEHVRNQQIARGKWRG